MSDKIKEDNISIEQIIAKIDNDFNPDNTDWIPRVAAWVSDALSQMNVLLTKRKRIKIPITNKIGISPYNLTNAVIYDCCGNKIPEAIADSGNCSCSSSTGEGEQSETTESSGATTTEITNNEDANEASEHVVSEQINGQYPTKYNVYEYYLGCKEPRNYVLIDNNKIELNLNTNCVQAEFDYIQTEMSSTYGCELPIIPNNGVLLEALTYFCMYKMLTRGYKHPVMNLAASQYGTNPYYMWLQLKEQAKRSIVNDKIDRDIADNSRMFRSGLYIDTFDPKRS